MTTLSLLALLTTGVGAAMIRLGFAHKALEPRRARRRCPSCGRIRSGAVCRVCARSER